jgi:hypothetical protein
MLHALMNEDNTVAKITNDSKIEWGGAVHSHVPLMTLAERQRFRIWDAIEDAGTPPSDPVADGEEQIVDADAKTVTVRKLWRSKTAEEIATATKAQAERTLAASDLGMARVVEDVLARQDALLATLVKKGVLTEEEKPALPKTAADKIAARVQLRANIAVAS